jgi:prepilin-type N-terminal cleavage/methylation domain-containing protein
MAHPRLAQGDLSKQRARRVAEAGFSLVELAIAVVIIGIMMTMGLAAMNAARTNQAFSTTIQKEATIKQALINYLRSNSRLPCPDTDFTAPDGIENRATAGDTTTACSAQFGIVPYVTLGLPRDAAQDGWSNFFSYEVSDTGTNTDWTRTANFYSGNSGLITVDTRSSTGTSTTLATGVVAVIVSHGPDGFGAYTIGGTRNWPIPALSIDESTNASGGTMFYQRDMTTDDTATGGAFDDIVLYMTANDLVGPLFLDGSLQTPAAMESTVSAEFQKIKTALIGYAMTHSTSHGGSSCNSWGSPYCRYLPYAASGTNGVATSGSGTTTPGYVPYSDLGLVSSDAIDPWGKYYEYLVNSTAASTGWGGGISSAQPTSSSTAVQLTSAGPDKTFGTTDDIVLNIAVGEIQGALAAGGYLP